MIFTDKEKTTFIYEIAKVMQAGNDAKTVVEFLEKNKELLCPDEYINVEIDMSKLGTGNSRFWGMLMLGHMYSVNIKYTTIMLAALLLDIMITSGFASTMLALTGISLQSIRKIGKDQKCILAEIAKRKTVREDDLDFYKKVCVWNNLDCQYREDDVCLRKNETLKKGIEKLLQDKVIHNVKGTLKIAF